MNACTRSHPEQPELSPALVRLPKQPAFRPDFEVDRGRSVLHPGANPVPQAGIAPVRSSSGGGEMASAQFVCAHDPKDPPEFAIESSTTSATTPSAMVTAGTSADRIKLERFAKTSVALARCLSTNGGPAADRSAYEPLFASASSSLQNYRRAGGGEETGAGGARETDLAGSPVIRPGCD